MSKSKYISDEKFLEFKDELYSYGDLHELHYKGYTPFQEGEVKNLKTGLILDISEIKSFYHYALIDLNSIIKDKCPELPSDKRKYLMNYMNDKQFKDWMTDIKLKLENGTATDEQIRQYWEVKSYGKPFEEIKQTWYPKNYIKVNQDFLLEINGLTNSEKGKLFNMMYYITYNNKEDREHLMLDRQLLSDILGTTSMPDIRNYMKKLEQNEILVRIDKSKHKKITLMFNPLFILKGAEKELTYNMLKTFPKSFNKFIDVDVIRLIEAKERLNVVLAETELDCIDEENTEGVLIGK